MINQNYPIVLHRDSQRREAGTLAVSRYVFGFHDDLDHNSPDGDGSLHYIVDSIFLKVDERVPERTRKIAKLQVVKALLPYARTEEDFIYLAGRLDGMTPLATGPEIKEGNVYDGFVVNGGSDKFEKEVF